jgi:CRP-like cAMP-binding protein
MDKEHLIQSIQAQLTVASQTAADIAAQFEDMEVPKNSYFLKEGQNGYHYMFLEEGFMRAYTFDPAGNEVTTGFYTKGQMVFEVSSFFTHTRSKENIQAITDCRGYAITFQQLNMLFHSIPEFREFGRAMLVKGFVALKQRTLSLINEKAEQRYINLIENAPEIFQHAQLKHIASYLGITDTSLSLLIKKYKKK